jgi:hypothetical protein
VVSLFAALAGAAAAQPIGGQEFQVNTYTTAWQTRPSVATDGAGNFVVAWTGAGVGGYGVYARRFDSSGNPQGTELAVGSATGEPRVAADPAGNFVVAWSAFNVGDDILARRYDASGTPLGPEFVVNTYTTGPQDYPDVGTDSAGNMVIVWQSFGQDGDLTSVHGQRYDSAGVPQGSEFQVNTYTTGMQYNPRVAVAGGGNFVVVWRRDDTSRLISAQRFDNAGTPQGGEFQVDTLHGYTPDAAFDTSGNFVVTWSGVEDDTAGIWVRRFDSTGTPQGARFRLDTVPGDHFDPHVAVGAASNYVVAWRTRFGGRYDVHARRFDGTGTTAGPDFQVNVYYTANQHIGGVASGTGNDFVITWYSTPDPTYLPGQDGDDSGVFARRWTATAPLSGQSVVVKDPADDTRRKVVFRSRDPIVSGIPGSGLDPETDGAFLHVFNDAGSGDSVCLALPASGWTRVGSATDRPIYRYRDPGYVNGPCNSAYLGHGRLLRVSCHAQVAPIGYSLNEVFQESVGASLKSGGAEYCARFGGTLSADQPGVFRARQAPPPATCPVPPASCP